jgi:uncharacterized protein
MRSLSLGQIRLTDPFWSHWQRVLVESTLPAQFDQIVATGRLENFLRAGRGERGGHQGRFYNDSDVYKWVEACAYALAVCPDAELRRRMEEVIGAIVGAQEEDGYLNTFFQLEHPHLKYRNLNTMHELYCGGHLIEAGVAVYENLGDRRLLDAALAYADHVAGIFGPDARRGYCGHQEIELALLRLSRVAGQTKYSDLARWMVEERGRAPSVFEAEFDDEEAMALSPQAYGYLRKEGRYRGEYAQDHAPIREHREIVGHAVRAMYFYMAATELADGQDDRELEEALFAIWNNLTGRRMYVTGGIGPSAHNEGFTGDYDLPNLSAYAETCASCGLIFWGHRLLQLTANSDFADVVERALYNGALSGVSYDGGRFFYTNPLESRGGHERTAWFDCACCPPNLARLLGSLPQYVVGVWDDAFFVHIPAGFEADATFGDVPVKIRLEGNYPWSGKMTLSVEPARPVEFALYLRIPDWADEIELEIEGDEEPAEYEAGYAVFRRTWRAGDRLRIEFDMQPRWVEAHPKVRENLGRVALTRGPLVYAAEAHDVGFAPQLLTVDAEAPVEVRERKKPGPHVALEVEAVAEEETFAEGLYAPIGTAERGEQSALFLPYYLWNNRGPTDMQVWVRRM